MYVPFLFTPSSVSGYLGYFRFLTIVNNATIKIGTQISVQVSTTTSFEYIPRVKLLRLYSNSIFNFLRTHLVAFLNFRTEEQYVKGNIAIAIVLMIEVLRSKFASLSWPSVKYVILGRLPV